MNFTIKSQYMFSAYVYVETVLFSQINLNVWGPNPLCSELLLEMAYLVLKSSTSEGPVTHELCENECYYNCERKKNAGFNTLRNCWNKYWKVLIWMIFWDPLGWCLMILQNINVLYCVFSILHSRSIQSHLSLELKYIVTWNNMCTNNWTVSDHNKTLLHF